MKKSEKNTPKKHDLDFIIEAIANSISEDTNEAQSYLKEEGVDVNKFMVKDLAFIRKMKAQRLLQQGKTRQSWFQKKKEQFDDFLKNYPEKAKAELSSLQLNFSKFDLSNLDESEIEKLFEDASFLNYIESKFDEEETPE